MPNLTDLTVAAFLDETASSSPAPGGGSVSALSAALAAALASMVARLTIGKKKYAEVEPEFREALDRSEALRSRCLKLIDEDTAAFNAVMAAFAMPKESEADKLARGKAIEEATKTATKVPMDLLRTVAGLVSFVEAAATRGNANSRSDAGVAALLAGTAARGAALNVYINLSGLKDERFRTEAMSETERIEDEVAVRCAAIARNVRDAVRT